MQIYLPIAEIPIDIFALLLLGIASGLMSGVFGIGGNFVVIPTLMFIGVPSAVALSSAVNHTVASSFSSFLSHLKRKNVDIGIGLWLLFGSFIGSIVGAMLFSWLHESGAIDITISLLYVFILGIMGVIIACESAVTIYRKHKSIALLDQSKKSGIKKKSFMPFKHLFVHSNVEVSILSVILSGIMIGMLVSLAGLGGGFVLVPILIYVLGLPTSIAVGTSVFQAVFTTSVVTMMHASISNTVDIVLSLFLIVGAVIGAQIGVRINSKLPPEILRILLAVIILCVFSKLFSGMVMEPKNIYSFEYK